MFDGDERTLLELLLFVFPLLPLLLDDCVELIDDVADIFLHDYGSLAHQMFR